MKKVIIIISSFLGIITLFFVIDFLASPIRDVTSKTEMKLDTKTKMEYVPTKDELVHLKGDHLQFLGFYEVNAIRLNKQPRITLINEKKEKINFSISIIDKQKESFSIPAIQFSPQNLQLGDSFGLAKKSAHYYAYKRNLPIADTTHTTN